MLIDKLKEFASWERDVQEACVLMMNMNQNTKEPKYQRTKGSQSPKNKETKKRKRSGGYVPKRNWSDEDRLALFVEFENGNKDWKALARKFGRSAAAIVAQKDKEYVAWLDSGKIKYTT